MLAQEMVAAVVPTEDIVFVESAWDALLRSAYKHVAIRCVCGVRVISLWIWETRGQDYKEISSMDWCSTHNLCSEMT